MNWTSVQQYVWFVVWDAKNIFPFVHPKASTLQRSYKAPPPQYWTSWRRQAESGVYLSLPTYLSQRGAQLRPGSPGAAPSHTSWHACPNALITSQSHACFHTHTQDLHDPAPNHCDYWELMNGVQFILFKGYENYMIPRLKINRITSKEDKIQNQSGWHLKMYLYTNISPSCRVKCKNCHWTASTEWQCPLSRGFLEVQYRSGLHVRWRFLTFSPETYFTQVHKFRHECLADTLQVHT